MSDNTLGNQVPCPDLLRSIDPDENFFSSLFNSIDQPKQSEYYTVERFSSDFNYSITDLMIVSFNIRSFRANGECFLSFLESLPRLPDIIILTETWLTKDSENSCFIDGYDSYHSFRREGRGGGVSIFWTTNLNCVPMTDLCVITDTIESCIVGVSVGNVEYVIFGIYRPHSDSIENFTMTVEEMLKHDDIVNKKIIVAGDFNVNILCQESPSSNLFLNTMHSMYFLPIITKPTRFPAETLNQDPSLLDHIWLNCVQMYNSGIFLTDITDHCPTFVILPGLLHSDSKVKMSFRSQNPNCIKKFVDMVSSASWNFSELQSVGDRTSRFISVINSMYRKCFPLQVKYVSVKRILKPWLTSGILKSIKTKSLYFKLLKLGQISELTNRQYKNKLTSVIRKAKNMHYKKLFSDNRTDLKKTWQIIRRLIGQNTSRRSVKSIIVDGVGVTDEKLIADSFNNFFSNIAVNLDNNLPNSNLSPLDYVDHNTTSSFFTRPVSAVECSTIISALKNTKYSNDMLPVRLLILVRDIISRPLSELISYSFVTGEFPDVLKSATVTPIFKAGDRSCVSNYRPISVLPLFSKIFEKCMAVRLMEFSNQFSLICGEQFGFQSGKSTSGAIIRLTEFIYDSLNRGNHSISIFIDFKKAFDTVNHKILLDKLCCYGVGGMALHWFGSYLKDRNQMVRVGNSLSNRSVLNVGIPQGSVLGPILFIFYVNDIVRVSNVLVPLLFADDTTFSASNRDYPVLMDIINSELDKVRDWTIANRLSLNVSKTFAMLYTNRMRSVDANAEIFLNNETVEFKSTGGFLGVRMDTCLKFDHHVAGVCSKLSKTIGILYKLQSCLPTNSLVNLYYNLVYPYLIYCNVAWGGTYNAHLGQLIIMQKKIIRIITKQSYLEHTTPLFKQTKILKVVDIHVYLKAIWIFKQRSTHSLPLTQHEHYTRNRDDLPANFQRLTGTQRSISYSGPQIWNSLPLGIRNLQTEKAFKNKLKDYLISFYI